MDMDAARQSYFQRRAEMDKYFVPENQNKEPLEQASPSGKYRLRVWSYETGEGHWAYSRGEVFCGDTRIAEVKRNYSTFPFAFVEAHPDGHDYLVCSQDYQAYTVIRLDTGERVDLLPEPVSKTVTYVDSGKEKELTVVTHANTYGFCWAAIHPHPNKTILAVDGCLWACPYEVRLLDFTSPLQVPFKVLDTWDDIESFGNWNSDGSVTLKREVCVRKSDQKPMDDLESEELEVLKDEDLEDIQVPRRWAPSCLGFAAESA